MKGPFKLSLNLSDGAGVDRGTTTIVVDTQEDLVLVQDKLSKALEELRHSKIDSTKKK